MGKEKETFNDFVINSILVNNPYGIEEVHNLESLNSLYFIQEKYPEIRNLIYNQDIRTLKELKNNTDSSTEFLEIMVFQDQAGKQYIVTVYDNNNLWQDPQLIDVFQLNKK